MSSKSLLPASGNSGAVTTVNPNFKLTLYTGDGTNSRAIPNNLDVTNVETLNFNRRLDISSPFKVQDSATVYTNGYLDTTSSAVINTTGEPINSQTSNGIKLNNPDGNVLNGTYLNMAWSKASGVFDIVKYAGTQCATYLTTNVSHNLGSIPSMVIIKNLDDATDDWHVKIATSVDFSLNNNSSVGSQLINSATTTVLNVDKLLCRQDVDLYLYSQTPDNIIMNYNSLQAGLASKLFFGIVGTNAVFVSQNTDSMVYAVPANNLTTGVITTVDTLSTFGLYANSNISRGRTVNGKMFIGDYYTNNYVYSSDGITWGKSTFPATITSSGGKYNIHYTNGKYFIGYGSVFATSTDGITWSATTGPTISNENNTCVIGGNLYVLSATMGYKSVDGGVTWTSYSHSGFNNLGPASINIIVGSTIVRWDISSKKKFVSTDAGVTYDAGTLTNLTGTTFTSGVLLAPAHSASVAEIFYAVDTYVMAVSIARVGTCGLYPPNLYRTSTDGVTWGPWQYTNGNVYLTGSTTTINYKNGTKYLFGSGYFTSLSTTTNVPAYTQTQVAKTYNYIAYLFGDKTGIQKASSYIGNGSATTGLKITLDFKPRMIWIKASSATGNWWMFDAETEQAYASGLLDYASTINLASAAVATQDVISTWDGTGFTVLHNTTVSCNATGVTYFYYAVA